MSHRQSPNPLAKKLLLKVTGMSPACLGTSGQLGTSSSQNASCGCSQKSLVVQERKKKYRIEVKVISVGLVPREETAKDGSGRSRIMFVAKCCVWLQPVDSVAVGNLLSERESRQVAGWARGCGCSLLTCGFVSAWARGQMCSRCKAECKNQHLEDPPCKMNRRLACWQGKRNFFFREKQAWLAVARWAAACGLLTACGLWLCDGACGRGADSGFLPLVAADRQLTARLRAGGGKKKEGLEPKQSASQVSQE